MMPRVLCMAVLLTWILSALPAVGQDEEPTPKPTPLPAVTDTLPLIPDDVRQHLREIYARGQELGKQPQAFSKIGDCNFTNPFFLYNFDSGKYKLGPFTYLQSTIDYFAGSFLRYSQTVWTGNHTWSVLDATWSNPNQCIRGETPLACEFRIHRPSFVLIRLGTNDAASPDLFTKHMRDILAYCIDKGVIPILGTKPDRYEGSDAVNDIIRVLAAEYRVPLWDFARIAETLPNGGLGNDGVHMQTANLDFTNPTAFQRGHTMQSLTALMALHTALQEVMR